MAFSGGFLAVKPKLEQNITKHVPSHRCIEKLALKNATAGKYFVIANIILQSGSNSNFSFGFVELYKNSSVITESVFDDRGDDPAWSSQLLLLFYYANDWMPFAL